MGSKAAVLRSLASYFFEKPALLQAGIDEKTEVQVTCRLLRLRFSALRRRQSSRHRLFYLPKMLLDNACMMPSSCSFRGRAGS